MAVMLFVRRVPVMAKRAEHTEQPRSVGSLLANVLGGILCVIFIPIIICNVILIARSYLAPDRLPTVFGFSPVIVLSGSMYPEFDAGDLILLKEVDAEEVQKDDVICYFSDGNKETAITHRVMDVQKDDEGNPVFVTKGDANDSEDLTAVTAEMVQGRYTGVYLPKLGDVAVFLQTPMGMVLCIVCPLGLILIWDAVRRMLASKKTAKAAQGMEEELERLRAQVAQQNSEQDEA